MTRLLSLLSQYTMPQCGNPFWRSARSSAVSRRPRRRTWLFMEALEQPSLLTRLHVQPLEERLVLSGVSISVGDASAIEGSSALKFIDQFVSPGNGGLSTPRQSVFGPDGSLYVASSATDSVLRYN